MDTLQHKLQSYYLSPSIFFVFMFVSVWTNLSASQLISQINPSDPTTFGCQTCRKLIPREVATMDLSPSICPLCLANSEHLKHLLFDCSYSCRRSWMKLFSFNLHWTFGLHYKKIFLSVGWSIITT